MRTLVTATHMRTASSVASSSSYSPPFSSSLDDAAAAATFFFPPEDALDEAINSGDANAGEACALAQNLAENNARPRSPAGDSEAHDEANVGVDLFASRDTFSVLASRLDEALLAATAAAAEVAATSNSGERYSPSSTSNSGGDTALRVPIDDEKDTTYALKIVLLSDQHSREEKLRMMNEPRCLLLCRDFFSIVACHDTFALHDGDCASANEEKKEFPAMIGLVIDLAPAGDLRRAIRQRKAANAPFREHEAGMMFAQILLAVHHCHAMGVMHRDLKTANVFVMADGTLKLGDFGHSRCYFADGGEGSMDKAQCPIAAWAAGREGDPIDEPTANNGDGDDLPSFVDLSERLGRTLCGTPWA